MPPRTGVQSIRLTFLPRHETPVLVRPRPQPTVHENVVEAMAAMLSLKKPGSTAEALKSLRLAYPGYPLALRLAGLAAAMKRNAPDPNGIYIPR